MSEDNKSAARARAVSDVEEGLRQLNRALRLVTMEVVRKVDSAGRGLRPEPSPGRRLHGRYVGLIRYLPIREKAKVRSIRARKGVVDAIKLAEEMKRGR
jgi:hypothetical protein